MHGTNDGQATQKAEWRSAAMHEADAPPSVKSGRFLGAKRPAMRRLGGTMKILAKIWDSIVAAFKECVKASIELGTYL